MLAAKTYHIRTLLSPKAPDSEKSAFRTFHYHFAENQQNYHLPQWLSRKMAPFTSELEDFPYSPSVNLKCLDLEATISSLKNLGASLEAQGVSEDDNYRWAIVKDPSGTEFFLWWKRP